MRTSKIKLDPSSIKLRIGDKREIWCAIRQRWMVCTPEEIVRQSLVRFLIDEKNYWETHIAVEKMLKNAASRVRFDLVAFRQDLSPLLLAECKAPHVPITDDVVKQLLKYNLKIEAELLITTNGIETYVYDTKFRDWVEDIPTY